MNNNKAFFFDRDGVLNKAVIKNKKPYPPQNLEKLILNKDALEIITFLKKLEFFEFKSSLKLFKYFINKI